MDVTNFGISLNGLNDSPSHTYYIDSESQNEDDEFSIIKKDCDLLISNSKESVEGASKCVYFVHQERRDSLAEEDSCNILLEVETPDEDDIADSCVTDESRILVLGDTSKVSHDHNFAKRTKFELKTNDEKSKVVVPAISTYQEESEEIYTSLSYMLSTTDGKSVQVQLLDSSGNLVTPLHGNQHHMQDLEILNTDILDSTIELDSMEILERPIISKSPSILPLEEDYEVAVFEEIDELPPTSTITFEESDELPSTSTMSHEEVVFLTAVDTTPVVNPIIFNKSCALSTSSNRLSRKSLLKRPTPILESSILNICVAGGFSVQLQRYIYPHPLCRVCLLAKTNMVNLFEDLNITDKGLIENTKGPHQSNRYNLLAAMKTLLDVDVNYGDCLPDHICIDCLDTLMSFSVFRKQISQGQSRLAGVIEQVKGSSTPTVIPPMGEVDARKVDIYRNADSIVQMSEIFKTSVFTHNVVRFLPHTVIDKIFNVFANTLGVKSERLKCLEPYVMDAPFVKGWLCKACGILIRGNVEMFTQHYENLHDTAAGDVRFPCDICGEAFLRLDNTGISDSYAEHWLQHFFFQKCNKCEKVLPSQKSVWAHKQSAHPDGSRSVSCNVCNRTFNKRTHLSSHMRIHLNPEQKKRLLNWCKICGKGLRSSLKAHMDSLHSDVRSWKCEICSKQFKRKETLMAHRYSVHLKKSRCELCNEIIKYDSMGVHTHFKCKGDLKYKCKCCQKRFVTESNLASHKLTHRCDPDEVLSTCTQCVPNRTFARKEYLIQHMKIHSGENPYKCPHYNCQKEIRMKSNYLKHLRVHKKRQENGQEVIEIDLVQE